MPERATPGLDRRLAALLRGLRDGQGVIVALTGAGISAESGIPTFRGPGGYWRMGSVEYRSEAIATWAMFRRAPREVWSWYLYRRGVCLDAEPNAAHRALASLGRALGERFSLVTQNVDGLHQRAGSPQSQLFEVHGNLHRARCARGCRGPAELRAGLRWHGRDAELPEDVLAALRCPRCDSWLRPHVLWFDECYDEENYHSDSALASAAGAALLLVVGTSGATNLPDRMVRLAAARGVPVVVVDPEPTPFSALALRSGGCFLQGRATTFLPALAGALVRPAALP